jgi:hypothetical protein
VTLLSMLFAWLAIAPSASFAAAPTIAGAPSLSPGGATVNGGGNGVDYYKVALHGGDELQLSVGPSGSSDYEFDLFAPDTTDATFTQSPPVDAGTTNPPYGNSPQVVTVQAPYSGTFIVAACSPTDAVDNGGDCRQAVMNPHNVVSPMSGYSVAPSLVGGGVSADCASSQTRAGRTIAAASAISVGSCEAGGGSATDYWTVKLNGGDQLQLTVAPPSGTGALELELYGEGTTDSTFTQAAPVDVGSASAFGSGGAPQVVTLQAPYTGTFVLAACAPVSAFGSSDCRAIETGGARNFTIPVPPYTFTSALVNGGIGADCAATEAKASKTIGDTHSLLSGACETGGGNAIDFWDVELGAGEQLTMPVSPPSSSGVEFDLYASGTTDTSFTQAVPVDSDTVSGGGLGTATLTAADAGRYVVAVCEPGPAGTTADCRAIQTGGGRDFTLPMRPYTFAPTILPFGFDPGAGGSSGTGGGFGDLGSFGSYPYGSDGTNPIGTSSTTALSTLKLSKQTLSVSKKHTISVTLKCTGLPCSGKLKLTAVEKTTSGKGAKRKTVKKTVTLASVPFSYISDTSKLVVKLNSTGLSLLKKGHGKLAVTATATYDPGTGKNASAKTSLALRGKT